MANVYDLFKTDKTFNAFKRINIKPSDQMGVGLQLRELKQSLLQNQQVKENIINIFSPILDQFGDSYYQRSSEPSYYEYTGNTTTDDLAIINDTVYHDLEILFFTYGQLMDNDGYALTFTTSGGESYSIVWFPDNTHGLGALHGFYANIDSNYIPYGTRVVDQTSSEVKTFRWRNYLTNSRGQNISLVDFLADLSDSCDIQQIFAESINISDENFLSYDLSERLSKYNSRNNDILDVVNKLRTASITGGVPAVLTIIKDCYTNLSNVQASPDTTLIEYVDDSVWMPKSFMAGVVNTIVDSIGVVISAIGFAINAVIGVIASCVSLIISGITRLINLNERTSANYVNTYQSIPCFGIAISKSEGKDFLNNYTPDAYASLDDCLMTNNVPILANAREAWHIISHGINDSNQEVVRMNSFIDLIDRRSQLLSLIPSLVTVSEWGGGVRPLKEYNISNANVNSILDWNDASGSQYYTPVLNGDGTLTSESDQDLREIVMANLLLYILHVSNADLYFSYHLGVSTTNSGIIWDAINQQEYQNSNMTSDEFKSVCHVLAWTVIWLYTGHVNTTTMPSWSDISLCFSALCNKGLKLMDDSFWVYKSGIYEQPNGNYFSNIFGNRNEVYQYTNSLCIYQDSFLPALLPPQYDRSELIAGLAIIGAVTIATAVTAVVVSRKLSRSIQRKKAVMAANVENSYNNFLENPTSIEAYNQYRKNVFKNNMFSSIFGGTKYSKINYWQGSSDSESTPVSKRMLGLLTSNDSAPNADVQGIEQIIKLIRGH